MAGEPLSYWDYVKAAFWQPGALARAGRDAAHPDAARLVRRSPASSTPASGCSASPAIVAFVGGRSASERFQKLIEGERLLARSGNAEEQD